MIRIYRAIAVVFLTSLFGIGALFVRYCIFPFQKTRIHNYETLHKYWKFFINILEKTKIIKLEIDNKDKIGSIRNSIIVSTHPSLIDIVILMSIIPQATCFVADKLARNPFFKGMVDLLFILDVQSIDEWLENTIKKIDSGLNVVIFPMGTRHRENETPKIRRGTALIAQKSHRDIVMLNLKSDSDFLQINQPIYDAGDKTVKYNLSYIGKIDTKEFLKKYPDEVTFKTEVTKQISTSLYKKQN